MPRPSRAPAALATLLFGALASGGCAGAGVAAVGPLWSAIQIVTERSVQRTLPADLPAGSSATVDALTRMGIRVRGVERTDDRWAVSGDGDRVTVKAELSRVTANMTRLSLTVEAGRIGADKQTAEEILNQVVASLAAQNVAARRDVRPDRDPSSTDALSQLEAEVRRLRSEIERSGAIERSSALPRQEPSRAVPAPGRAGAAAVVVTDGVVTIPESSGLPTVPSSSSPQAWRPEVPVPSQVDAASSPGEDMLAGPLKPVGTLVPVQPVAGGRSSP